MVRGDLPPVPGYVFCLLVCFLKLPANRLSPVLHVGLYAQITTAQIIDLKTFLKPF